MTRTTPELAPPSPNFRATPAGGRLATTYDLACNRPHTRRIFSGIGFRTCDPPARGRNLTTRPPRPTSGSEKAYNFLSKCRKFYASDNASDYNFQLMKPVFRIYSKIFKNLSGKGIAGESKSFEESESSTSKLGIHEELFSFIYVEKKNIHFSLRCPVCQTLEPRRAPSRAGR
ncbi:hypothetical protein AVEN_223298-1 [Araneus ventricosus]|uniref:Uncharacterized protein n=1 Tax=Araneus ventricosus TaxID=182803 RepID=A0A4Y2GA68_ARAVE|nr:hypothetical protein AVEN_223298-1 [Araneus ventricosus]